LLLPQEVKEIGNDEAIIFALGLKPIRATKIRWFTDPTFKDRVRTAPVVTPAPLPTVTPIIDTSEFVGVSEADIATIYERPLRDFNLNFTDIQIPKHELSIEEAEALADQMYEGLRR
jgi:type IV secretory pathway TraG/TraD family ATPase VirD4